MMTAIFVFVFLLIAVDEVFMRCLCIIEWIHLLIIFNVIVDQEVSGCRLSAHWAVVWEGVEESCDFIDTIDKLWCKTKCVVSANLFSYLSLILCMALLDNVWRLVDNIRTQLTTYKPR